MIHDGKHGFAVGGPVLEGAIVHLKLAVRAGAVFENLGKLADNRARSEIVQHIVDQFEQFGPEDSVCVLGSYFKAHIN